MKKNMMIAAVAACVLASCSTTELDNSAEQGGGKPILFRVVTDKTGYATPTTTANLAGFTLNASKTTSDLFDFMKNVAVTKAAGETDWTYAPIKYFPTDGSVVSFLAYSPVGDVNITGITHNGTANTAQVLYTVPEKFSATGKAPVDFILGGTQSNAPLVSGKLQLTFGHMLSMVSFQASNSYAGATFVIESIELANLANKGTLNITSTTSIWTANFGTDNANVVKYMPSLSSSGIPITPNQTNIKLTSDNEKMMVLPQNLSSMGGTTTAKPVAPGGTAPTDYTDKSKSYLVVTFHSFDDANAPIHLTGTKQYIGLPQMFAKGTHYLFSLTFDSAGLSPINFSVVAIPDFSDGAIN